MRVIFCEESAGTTTENGQCLQIVPSEAVTNADDRSRHLVAFHINKV
jgi:hypothetical protein